MPEISDYKLTDEDDQDILAQSPIGIAKESLMAVLIWARPCGEDRGNAEIARIAVDALTRISKTERG